MVRRAGRQTSDQRDEGIRLVKAVLSFCSPGLAVEKVQHPG